MSKWHKTLAAVAVASALGTAQAAYIVDTGPGSAGSTMLSLVNLGGSFQHLGMSFNVAQDSMLDSAEGWMFGLGSLVFELRQGSTPDGAVLYSQAVSVSEQDHGWHGATALDWLVQAGDYTLTILAQPGFNGGMQTSPSNPAGTEWFINPLSQGWQSMGFNLGWRIGAAESSVPEPGGLALAGFGLLALIASRARRRPA